MADTCLRCGRPDAEHGDKPEDGPAYCGWTREMVQRSREDELQRQAVVNTYLVRTKRGRMVHKRGCSYAGWGNPWFWAEGRTRNQILRATVWLTVGFCKHCHPLSDLPADRPISEPPSLDDPPQSGRPLYTAGHLYGWGWFTCLMLATR